MRGNYASSRMRNAYPAYTTNSTIAMNLPLLANGTYKLILVSDIGVATTGSNVDSWADQSGNGYSAVPAGTAPTVNGTDGSRQTIRWGTTQSLKILSFALSTSYTMFVRGDLDDTSRNVFIEHGAVVDSQEGFMFNPSTLDANWGGVNRGGTKVLFRYTPADTITTRATWTAGYKASDQTWTARQNGVNYTQAGVLNGPVSTESVVTAQLNIGKRNGNTDPSTSAWISCIVICEGNLSAGEITSVESAISTYFS